MAICYDHAQAREIVTAQLNLNLSLRIGRNNTLIYVTIDTQGIIPRQDHTLSLVTDDILLVATITSIFN